jgi:hypothetical protein
MGVHFCVGTLRPLARLNSSAKVNKQQTANRSNCMKIMTMDIPRHTSPDCFFESLWLECPKLIARGTARDVYEIPGHRDKVLKVSNSQSNYSNWMEILVYDQFKDGDELAKIFSWSWSGRFVVMERLIPLSPGDLDSHRFPYYLTDRKPANYGKDALGNIKALDYAALTIAAPQSNFL